MRTKTNHTSLIIPFYPLQLFVRRRGAYICEGLKMPVLLWGTYMYAASLLDIMAGPVLERFLSHYRHNKQHCLSTIYISVFLQIFESA